MSFLQKVNSTESPYPDDRTIPALFAEQALRTPNAVAVINDEHHLTYRDLDAQSTGFAEVLVASGLRQEEIVALLVSRSPAAVVAMLGTLKAGGAYLPIDPDAPLERLKYVLRDSGSAILASDKAHAESVRALSDGLQSRRALTFVDISEACSESGVRVGLEEMPRCRPRSLAYVIYTSGTTGRPKGVMVEHKAVLRLVTGTNYIRLTPEHRILQTGALSFDASTFEIWGALLNGGSVCLAPRHSVLDVAAVKELIARHGITTMFVTTALFNAFAANDVSVFSELETILTGGEKASPRHFNTVRAACPNLTLKHVYGPTENTTFTTFHDVTRDYDRNVPIGRPVANTTVHILDQDLEPVNVGEVGELFTGGDGLARGYLNDPDLTAEKFIVHPPGSDRRVYRTGDLARWLPDGTVEFVGRNDDQVKIRGYRVDPAEVVDRLLEHASIRAAAVIPKSSANDVTLAAYFTASDRVDFAALREHLGATLPEYMIPAFFLQLERLPLTPNGKVDKTALPDPETIPREATATDRPLTETEKLLAGIWQEVLGRTDIGLDDDFFALGGHSLKALTLNSLIHARTGLILPFTQVFTAPTIRQLSQCILDAASFGTAAIDTPMVLLNGEHGERPLFAFPPATGDALGYAELAERLKPYAFYAFNFIEADTRFKDYADLIGNVVPEEPCLLFGYSGGGNLAYHTARELEGRGRQVSDIVMLDSSRFLNRLQFPEDEARRLASSFLADKHVMQYVSSPVLRDKATRVIQKYYSFFSMNEDFGSVEANIHVITSQGSPDAHYDETGRIICSQSAWRDATRGAFRIQQGCGHHNTMLHPQHIDGNARLLRDIMARVYTADLATSAS